VKNSELSREVRELIFAGVPTLEALELLICLARCPGRMWTLEQLTEGVPQLKQTEAREYLSLFVACRLVRADGAGHEFAPDTALLAEAVAGLLRAYDERPVTLIRTVYALADERKIQSFADAFRLKRKP
jgi:hypothetical protein